MFSGPSRPGRGVSLVEIMIASGLLFTVLISVGQFVTTSFAYYKSTEEQIELESSALLGLRRISTDITESSQLSLVIEPNAIVVASPRDDNGVITWFGDGQPLWQRLLCYQLESVAGTQCMVRRSVSLATPSTDAPDPLTLAPPRLPAWFALSSLAPPRVMARGAVGLQISEEIVDAQTEERVVKVVLELSTAHFNRGNDYGVVVETRAHPRN